ncbi:MAG: hypothetical protein MJE12_24220 [Alphaproteobacteria bacterium]|nr:hypothetical protein [Alphaproteobacteria bacterium]
MRSIVAAVAAGIAGTVVNAFAVAAVVSTDKLSLALVPGRYAIGIALCLVLPLLHSVLSVRAFYAFAAAFLTLGASLLAKFVFLATAPWGAVLGFNLVYALAAIVVFRAIAGPAAAKVELVKARD